MGMARYMPVPRAAGETLSASSAETVQASISTAPVAGGCATASWPDVSSAGGGTAA